MYAPRPTRSRRKTLRVQADVPHTFGTLLIPLALALLAGGIFLVQLPLADPLGAGAESVLLGSVVLASGLLLVAYLLRSVRRTALARAKERNSEGDEPMRLAVVRRTRISNTTPSPALPFQRVYVDDVRISL